MIVFIDASYYLSLLSPFDNNHQKALELASLFKDAGYVTTQMVLGEVLTVGSQRFDKRLTIKFVETIMESQTRIFLEKQELVLAAFDKFKALKSKNISWVDCYSYAICQKLKIKQFLSFDKHLSQLLKKL